MELMNQYYVYEIKENGQEIEISSNDSKHQLIAFFNFEDKEGNISKNMMEGVQYKSFKRWIKGLMSHRDIDLSKEIDLDLFFKTGELHMINEEVSEVEQIKIESQEVINSINTETLETQNKSLELISQQLDKVNDAIEKNLENEEIRQQLRDIENNLKYNYSGVYEMIEKQTCPDANDFNNIETLKDVYITNWNELPQEIQKYILSCNKYWIDLQEIILYHDSQAVASIGISGHSKHDIEINSIGAGEKGNLFQWNTTNGYTLNNLEMSADKQESKIKVTHNEYEKICKELASRIYAKDETKITYKQYDQMLDNYEILPFEINTDNKELKKTINTYADNETIEADRVLYRGSIDKSILYNLLNESEGYNDLYIEYYQMIICNKN